jgi:leucyl aminopeptidase
MDIKLVNQPVKIIDCDALIVGAVRAGKRAESQVGLFTTAKEVDQLLDELITSICNHSDFRGNLGETVQIYTMGKIKARRVIVVGLGSAEKLQCHTFRRASGMAVRFAQSKGARHIALTLDEQDNRVDEAEALQAAVEGALLGIYSFRKYLTTQSNERKIECIRFLSKRAKEKAQQEALRRGIIIAEAANFARDLVNEQPSVLTPSELAERTSVMAQQFGLECEILEQAKIEELGMGGLVAVTKGSPEPPKFLILRYCGAPQSLNKGIALVGKGITFDSGGLSLKTIQGMEDMKGDMAGAAAVIGAMQVIASLKPAINVTALIPASENMLDGASYRPGDILRMMNGKTIEIVNTDAEGRLVLADALSYAVEEGYTTIIDIATLTGAATVALGGRRAALFSNSDELSQELMEAGESVGEKFWRMPMDDEYQDMIESHIADIRQSGSRFGAAIIAAKILEHFVGEANWVHLDIAGMEFNETRNSFVGAGATGFGTRALAVFLLKRADKQK